jgi:hypothetical protein
MNDTIAIPNNSYAFLDFINEEERLELKQWVMWLFDRKYLKPNTVSNGRFFARASELSISPIPLFFKIKRRLMDRENLCDTYQDEFLDDFISINTEGAEIQKHTDPNRTNHIHTRYNLIVNKPPEGGMPVYGDQIVGYENRMLWRCEAGKYIHCSTPVIGPEYRINISYGFQIPIPTL